MALCGYFVFVLSCAQVAALWRADSLSKMSCRLCTGLWKWKIVQGPTKGCGTIDEWTNWLATNNCMCSVWNVWTRTQPRCVEPSLELPLRLCNDSASVTEVMFCITCGGIWTDCKESYLCGMHVVWVFNVRWGLCCSGHSELVVCVILWRTEVVLSCCLL